MELPNEQSVLEITDTKYAQLVSSIISGYDLTLVFHQANAVQTNKADITKFKATTKEVARVIMPLKAAIELKDLLTKQIETVEKRSKAAEREVKKRDTKK